MLNCRNSQSSPMDCERGKGADEQRKFVSRVYIIFRGLYYGERFLLLVCLLLNSLLSILVISRRHYYMVIRN
jgi:hypothetical protein